MKLALKNTQRQKAMTIFQTLHNFTYALAVIRVSPRYPIVFALVTAPLMSFSVGGWRWGARFAWLFWQIT